MKKPPETSEAAFAASGMAAFASKSPFGAFGGAKAGSGSAFGSFGSKKPTTTGFGSATTIGGPSPFASKGSGGFGGLGSGTGFGGLGASPFASTGLGKSSFASPLASVDSSQASKLGVSRTIGKADDDDDEDETKESGIRTVDAGEVQDDRFHAQQSEFCPSPTFSPLPHFPSADRSQWKPVKRARKHSSALGRDSISSKPRSGKNVELELSSLIAR